MRRELVKRIIEERIIKAERKIGATNKVELKGAWNKFGASKKLSGPLYSLEDKRDEFILETEKDQTKRCRLLDYRFHPKSEQLEAFKGT